MSTTFSVRGVPCILTRFLSAFNQYNESLTTAQYATALAAVNAYDMTTIPWGATQDVQYNPDGSTTKTLVNYWNNTNLFAALGQPFSRAAITWTGSGVLYFQIQRAQALIFCPCDYNIPEFDWAAGVFQPAPTGQTPTSCSDGTVTIGAIPYTGQTVAVDLPADAGSLPGYSQAESFATWKLLNLGALCS
jgi:hypothetical protein